MSAASLDPYFDVNSTWVSMLKDLMYQHDFDVSPRGQGTQEVIGYQTVVDMNAPIISIPSRKMNYRFMCGEAWWILSGSNRVSDITPYLKNIAKFSDNGITFNGAYGPKVVDQLEYVVSSLISDVDCRQAVMKIWRENPRPSKDIPCTLSLQFFIRNNTLHTIATMRSSDAWLGWVYDVFNFSAISAWIAIALQKYYPGLKLGRLYLTAGSQHIYERDIDAAKQVIQECKESSFFNCRDLTPIRLGVYRSPDKFLEDLKYGADERWRACSPYTRQFEFLGGK